MLEEDRIQIQTPENSLVKDKILHEPIILNAIIINLDLKLSIWRLV